MGLLIFTLGLSRTYEVYYAKRFDFEILTIRSVVAALLGSVAGVSLAVGGFGVWSLVAQQLVAGAASLALLWYGASWQPVLRLTIPAFKKEVMAAKTLAISNVLGLPISDSDLLIVTACNGAAAGGIYSAAKRIVLAANMIASYSTQNLTLTYFAHVDDGSDATSRLPQAAEVVTPLLVLVFVGLSVVSGDAVAVLLGKKWLASADVLAWLALGSLFQGLASFLYGFMIVEHAAAVRTRIMAVGAAAMVVVLYAASHWGYVAVAAGGTIVSLAMYLVCVTVACRIAGCLSGDIFRQNLRIALCALVMVACGLALQHVLSPLLSLAMLPIVLGLLYLGMMQWMLPTSLQTMMTGFRGKARPAV